MTSACEADAYIYESTYENTVLEKPFIAKEVQVVYDANNGVYNNQILFSTGMLNNTGKWIDYQNSYIQVPFTMALRANADITTTANQFMMGLKDSSIQLVDSLIVQYNGTSVIQNSIFTNIFQHFKILASWTQEDLTKWGAATVTAPDIPAAFRFSAAAASAFGDGLSNNTIGVTTAAKATYLNTNLNTNTGFQTRLRYTGTQVNNAVSGLWVNTAQSAANIARNFFSNNGGANAARVYYWQVALTIRLKDLSDFFNKLPLMKACRIDLTINFNAFSGTVTYAQGPPPTMITASFNQVAGHCCPFMLASCATAAGTTSLQDQPLAAADVAATTLLTVSAGINGVPGTLNGSTGSPAFNNCRWFISAYEMDPEWERQMLSKNPTKTIYYEDFYTFTSITNVNTMFSNLITAGVKNPQWIVLFPFFNNASTNSGNFMSNAPYQSMFDSAPGTTSPIEITNFQVQCGGVTMFPLIELYGFQQFMDEFSSIFALSGGKSDIVTSGLISKYSWENAPVYLCNLSRRLPADDGNNKSIQISGSVNSKKPYNGAADAIAAIDIIAFVVYQRRIEFNMLNSLIISDSLS